MTLQSIGRHFGGPAALAILAVCAPQAHAQNPVTGWIDSIGDKYFKGWGGEFAGFYAGGGLSMTESTFELPDSTSYVTIDDADTAGTDVDVVVNMDHAGKVEAGYLMGGFLAQKGKIIVGLEADYNFDNAVDFPLPAGIPECANPAVTTPGNFACIGLQSSGGFELKGHVRTLAGYEVTSNAMAFVAVGVAVGESPDRISARAGGFLSVPPNTPLAGLATVTRGDLAETVTGLSLGAGVEVRASDAVSIRAEFLHDDFDEIDIAVGGAGFGGTLADITVNSFAGIGTKVKHESQSVRISALYRF